MLELEQRLLKQLLRLLRQVDLSKDGAGGSPGDDGRPHAHTLHLHSSAGPGPPKHTPGL